MYVSFLAGVKFKRKIYFSALYMNAFMSYDLDAECIEYISSFEKENIQDVHSCAILHDGYIWFVPEAGNYIAYVKLEDYKMEWLELPSSSCFVNAIKHRERFLYLIPRGNCNRNLVKVDMTTKTVEDCGYVIAEGINGCAGGYIFGNELRMYSADGDTCCTYDLVSGEISGILNGGSIGYHSLECCDGYVALIPWEAERDTIKLVDVKKGTHILIGSTTGDSYNTGMVFNNNMMMIFPFDKTRKALIFDVSSEKKEITEKLLELSIDNGRWFQLRKIPTDDFENWCITSFGELWRYDNNAEVVEKHLLRLSEKEKNKIVENGLIRESLIKWGKVHSPINEGMGLATIDFFIKEIVQSKSIDQR